MLRFKSIILCCACCYSIGAAQAQSAGRDSTTRFFGVPLLFYTPDTRLGFGAAGIITFPGNPFRSSITFGLSYTLRKQFLVYLPYQWYSRNGKWRTYGELGWYRYIYQYFGIGNTYSNTYSENYTAQYPRVRITAVRRMNGHFFAGMRCFLDDYQIRTTEPGGSIDLGNLTGAAGGLTSAVGGVLLYDTRDNPFFPAKGWLLEAALTGENRFTGSDFRHTRLTIDAVRYWSPGKNSILAFNFLSTLGSGGAPFFNLPTLGGARRLRGYPDGKYRDRHLILFQAEWRFQLIGRFKGVVFGGAGSVFGSPGEHVVLRPNAGLGLRFEFDRKQHLHLRVDYGFGQDIGNSGAYITIGEAF